MWVSVAMTFSTGTSWILGLHEACSQSTTRVLPLRSPLNNTSSSVWLATLLCNQGTSPWHDAQISNSPPRRLHLLVSHQPTRALNKPCMWHMYSIYICGLYFHLILPSSHTAPCCFCHHLCVKNTQNTYPQGKSHENTHTQTNQQTHEQHVRRCLGKGNQSLHSNEEVLQLR